MGKDENRVQLYALIKSSSKHYHQRHYCVDKNGKPTHFKVDIPTTCGEFKGQVNGGPGGNYYIDELNFYVVINDKFVRISK
jgi:hypothetical protein